MAKDRQSKKDWDSANMVMVSFKLFRAINDNQNDQDLIDWLNSDKGRRSEKIKTVLRSHIGHETQQIDFTIIERGVSIAICATINGEKFYSAAEYETEAEAQERINTITTPAKGEKGQGEK